MGIATLVLFIYLGMTLVFVGAALGSATLLRYHHPGPVKASTYESGLHPTAPAWIRFRVSYYLYALLFVLLGVETALIYPWAVIFRRLGGAGLVEMAVFVALFLLGMAYAWREGALTWP